MREKTAASTQSVFGRKTHPIAGPSKGNLWRTLLFPVEVAGLPRALRRVEPRVVDAPPVIVVPGIWASDRTMWVLRLYLRRAGYDARGWGLGRNTAGAGWDGSLDDLAETWATRQRNDDSLDHPYNGEGEVPALCDRFGERIRHISEELGRPIALVGWSLGGFIAREAARDQPDHVAGIVTLGAPLIGGPKYTLTHNRFAKRGYDMDWIERECIARHERPLACPVTSIYSKRDAIVGWEASVDRWTPGARHHEVDCSHTAFGFHPPSLKLVRQELDRIFLRNPA